MSGVASFLNRISNGKTLVGAVLLYALFNGVLLKNAGDRMNEFAGKVIGPVDLTFGFNPARTLQMIADYGDQGRAYYRQVELTVDLVYPVLYAFLFAILITMIYRRLLGGPVSYLNLVAFLPMCFDFLENMAIVSLINHYPEQSFFIAFLCELFKLIKWLFFALVLFLVLYGFIKILFRRK